MAHQFELPPNFRHLYNASPIGICLVENTRRLKDGKPPRENDIIYANVAFHDILHPGFIPSPSIMKENIKRIFNPKTIPHFLPLPRGVKGSKTVEIPIDDPKEGRRWLQVSIKEMAETDTPCHIFWVSDVTDARQKQARLAGEAAKADALAESKSNFLATMSHEIRTPLQTIYGMLELMGEETPSERLREMINTSKNSANGLLEILDDILDLAKVDAGKMELDDFDIPLRTLVYGMIESLSVNKLRDELYLKAEFDESVPFVVKGDPKRLRQVLINLISNSLKFTEQGGITVHVSWLAMTKKEEKQHSDQSFILRIEVRDTGIGMSEAVCKKLFVPFTQANNSTTREYGGTGLGLSIAQRLVRLMGGKIGVNSEEGKGSTFWFEIPTRKAEDSVPTELPDLEGMAVLSIEDHPKGAKEIKSSLESMGARVTSISTYKEGYEMASARPYDVAVVDHGLPDGWGADLLRELNDIRPFMGLILYTVHDDYAIRQRCKFVGATYLSKPASRLGLGQTVKAAGKQTPQHDPNRSEHILVCEDNEVVRDILLRQLSKHDVKVDIALDGIEGLKKAQSGKYGLLITDLHMPKMDGYELARQIRADEKTASLPLVTITADVQLVHSQTYLKHGFDECLLKPVSLGQIRQLLVRWGLIKQEEGPVKEEKKHRKNKPSASAVDWDKLQQQIGPLHQKNKEMLQTFVDLGRRQIDMIEHAMEERDFDTLLDTAHSLKGGAHSACCDNLGEIAARIQNDAEERKIDKNNISALHESFLKVAAEIQPYLDNK